MLIWRTDRITQDLGKADYSTCQPECASSKVSMDNTEEQKKWLFPCPERACAGIVSFQKLDHDHPWVCTMCDETYKDLRHIADQIDEITLHYSYRGLVYMRLDSGIYRPSIETAPPNYYELVEDEDEDAFPDYYDEEEDDDF